LEADAVAIYFEADEKRATFSAIYGTSRAEIEAMAAFIVLTGLSSVKRHSENNFITLRPDIVCLHSFL